MATLLILSLQIWQLHVVILENYINHPHCYLAMANSLSLPLFATQVGYWCLLEGGSENRANICYIFPMQEIYHVQILLFYQTSLPMSCTTMPWQIYAKYHGKPPNHAWIYFPRNLHGKLPTYFHHGKSIALFPFDFTWDWWKLRRWWGWYAWRSLPKLSAPPADFLQIKWSAANLPWWLGGEGGTERKPDREGGNEVCIASQEGG